MKKMTLEQLMEFAVEQARGLFSIQEAIRPMVHAIAADGENFVIDAPGLGGTDKEKDHMTAQLRVFFKNKNIVQFVMMMEAWTLDLTKLPPGRTAPRPSASPDRKEVVALTASDETGELMGQMPIIRPKKGKPYLGELHSYRPEIAEGRFVGLLPTAARQQ